MEPDENAFMSPPPSPLDGGKCDEKNDVVDRNQLRSDVMSTLEEKRQQMRRQRSHSRQRVWRLKSQNRLGSNSSSFNGDASEV